MCSGSEAGAYFRLIDFVYHPTLGLRVLKKKKKEHNKTVMTGIRSVMTGSGPVMTYTSNNLNSLSFSLVAQKR